MPLPRALAPGSLLALVPALARGQDVLFELHGDSGGDRLGNDVCRVADLDGDGVPEFAVSATRATSPLVQAGRVRVHSGASGTVLLTFAGSAVFEELGAAVADIGDLDHDGKHDLAVGIRQYGTPGSRTGAVSVYSGATGAPWMLVLGPQADCEFGGSIAGVGDVDLDGVPDFAVGAAYWDLPNASSVGLVEVVSGGTGAILSSWHGSASNDWLGWDVANAGDADADGKDELLIGVRGDSSAGDRTGKVLVVRPSDGTTLLSISGDQPVMSLGVSVSGAGDVNGDGHADFLAGAPFHNDAQGYHRGLVRLFSGANGQVLREWEGDGILDQLGSSVAGGVDLNGDGVPEIVSGGAENYSGGLGVVRVYDGGTGQEIASFHGTVPDGEFGRSLAVLGDLDGDGRTEIAVGAPMAATQGGQAGQLIVCRTSLAPVSYCTAAVNSTGQGAHIDSSDSPSLSNTGFLLSTLQLVPNGPGLYFCGTARELVPFGDGSRCVGGSLERLGVEFAGTSGVSTLLIDLSQWASTGALAAGSTRNFQVWYRDLAAGGTGFNLSDGLAVTFVP